MDAGFGGLVGYWEKSAELLNSPEEIANAVAGYQRLATGGGGSIGSIVPPRIAAGAMVPVVSGLQVTAAPDAINGTSTVTLSWLEPHGFEERIATYNVYARRFLGSNDQPTLLAASRSPASFAFQTDAVNQVIFVVQTAMRNGQLSPIDLSPTCTATTVSPVLTPSAIAQPTIVVIGLTLTDNSLTAGNVAWSACTVYYSGVAYPVASGHTTGGKRLIIWTVGDATFTATNNYTSSLNTFLIATNTSGVADTSWNKVGSAVGLPPGGTAGQLLSKLSSDDYAADWATTAPAPYDLVCALVGLPGNAAKVCLFTATRAIALAANFVGSYGTVGVNPTATAAYAVKNGGTTIGTVSISTSGVFTFATTGGTAKTLAAGDRLTITAPTPQDVTLADVAFTLAGTS